MTEYDNTDRGTLFINTRKTTTKHPDFTGKINVRGTEYWISGWNQTIKKGKNAGNQFVSIAVGDVVEDKPASAPTSFPAADQKSELIDDDSTGDIPF